MTISRLKYLPAILLLFISSSRVEAGGRKITVITKSDMVFTGELLSVRAKEILISLRVDADDSALARTPALIRVIPDSVIRTIHSTGESHVGQGMAIGTGIGLGAGLVGLFIMESKASNSSSFGESLDYGLGGPALGATLTLGGFLIGTIAGAASSTSDINMGISEPLDFQKLVTSSRYSQDEPDFLRKVK